jgi:RNA polymerase sigma-70 factor (ECF subfamily)
MLHLCDIIAIYIVNAFKSVKGGEGYMKQSEYHKLLTEDKNKAQRELFNEYLNYVYTIVFNRLRSSGSREDIDECVSDVFADVFNSYEYSPDMTGDMKGFISTIAI